MNAGLLPIDNMLSGASGLGSAPLEPGAAKGVNSIVRRKTDSPDGTSPSSQVPANDPAAVCNNKPARPYNTPGAFKNGCINKKQQNFSHTLRARITPELSQKAEPSAKSEKQKPACTAPVQSKTIQLSLAQCSVNPQQCKEGTNTIAEPKPVYELGQLLAQKKEGKCLSGTGKAAQPVQTQSPLTVSQSQAGLKVVLPGTSSEESSTGDSKSNEGENTARMMGSKASLATNIISQQGGKKLMPEVPIAVNNRTNAGTEKPAVMQTSAPLDGQKAAPTAGKQLMPQTAGNASSQPTATDEKSAVYSGPRIYKLDSGFAAVQAQLSDPLSRLAGVSPEKPAVAAEKPAEKGTKGPQMPSGSLRNNGKESQLAGNNLSRDSNLHRLNVIESQVLTGQPKQRGGLTQNDSSQSGLEPMPSQGNTQSPATELFTDTFAQAPRPTNYTSPGSAFSSINEQILESIQSSVRQGEQQITIRLNPPELGKVSIELREEQDQITGLLEVDKIQTRYEIEHELPQIIRALQDAGIQIKRLEVVLTDQPEQQLFKEQSQEYASFQHNGSTEDGNPGNGSSEEWVENATRYSQMPEPQMLIADDAINMLA